MPIPDWIEKLGRTVFESPFELIEGSREAPEMAEIRLALLDEVKAKSHQVAGRKIFPYNVVRVTLRGIREDQSNIFNGPFFSQFLENEIRRGLTNLSYRFPDELKVEVATSADLPGPKDRWLSIDTESQAPAAAPAHSGKAKVVVARGSANKSELPLTKARVNIGRSVEVYRTDGPSRRNDLAFDESGEINKTVSREHAHIMYIKKTGEFRLFNDRNYKDPNKPGTNCGLWIIRDGLSLAVHHDARGTRLQSGDEIHLGRAILKFVLK